MPKEEFVAELTQLKQEINVEVREHFKNWEKEIGIEEFRSWRMRYRAFLHKYNLFEEIRAFSSTTMVADGYMATVREQHLHDTFETKWGKSIEAQIDRLLRDCQKGRLDNIFVIPSMTDYTNDANAKSDQDSDLYVDPTRLDELRSIQSEKYDLAKLIRLCEEINDSFVGRGYYSTSALTRAIIDHVPPLFDKKNFSEVANQHGGRSFSSAMKHLDNTSKKIADTLLHSQIDKKVVLPTKLQVNFSQDLDFLLAEIIKILAD